MASHPEINEKAQHLIKALVQRYIADGQPVGSKTLSEDSGLQVSPATIRNIMADLEDKGYVTSPHTSAGRVPTARAYRLFVDSLIQVEPLGNYDLEQLRQQLDPDMTAQELVESASGMLSEVTHMAGLVTIPRRDQVLLRHVEFLPLNDNRILVIMVLDDHEVQNRVIYTQERYSEAQLKEASNFINASFLGQTLGRVRERLINSMKSDRENMNSLMQTTLAVAEKAFAAEEDKADYVMAGQENLFDLYQTEALADLRELFKAFSLKGDILHLLDRCMDTDGIQLFIGHESGYQLLDDCSLVTSPYKVDGELVGVLGVIGPTRMAYQRVIPIVDATARILSAALDTSRPAR
ncbi:MAG: heat-inducible transcriptional repressor HrcA [Pseudomonadota bacterium]